jgi:hypothetical protein
MMCKAWWLGILWHRLRNFRLHYQKDCIEIAFTLMLLLPLNSVKLNLSYFNSKQFTLYHIILVVIRNMMWECVLVRVTQDVVRRRTLVNVVMDLKGSIQSRYFFIIWAIIPFWWSLFHAVNIKDVFYTYVLIMHSEYDNLHHNFKPQVLTSHFHNLKSRCSVIKAVEVN